jgi:transcriptional regulator with XRE-family HTH domain
VDRQALADFLRSRRERIAPSDVGLPAGRRRRTPGLRREEVAQLAHISAEYYTRLEQGRSAQPSREVLAGLVRALRLADAERAHLHHLAGVPPTPLFGPPRQVRPSILDLLHRLPLAAAIVVSADHEVLAWNALAAALMEDFSSVPPRDRNLLRRVFLGPHPNGVPLYGVSEADEFARRAVCNLRAAAARYPGSSGIKALVADLLAQSADFAALWAAPEVATEPRLRKTFQHRVVGPITVNCDVLDIADLDQHVVIYTADPGSPSEESLRLLSVIGTQRMDLAPEPHRW